MPLIESNVRVIVRVRPDTNENENQGENKSFISIDSSNNSIIIDRDKKGQSDFRFSGVMDQNASQEDVFNSCNLTEDVLNGINCCIIAYGQTGIFKGKSI